MNSMIIGIMLLVVFLFDHVKTLTVNFHKKRRVGQVKFLFLKLEVPFIFYVMFVIFFVFLLTKRLNHT